MLETITHTGLDDENSLGLSKMRIVSDRDKPLIYNINYKENNKMHEPELFLSQEFEEFSRPKKFENFDLFSNSEDLDRADETK